MPKKMTIIFTVLIATAIAVSYLTWDLLNPQIPNKYIKNIVRNFDSTQEENALQTAETLNYSTITSMKRFDGSSDPEAYLNPETYIEYTCSNFIDQEVIDYYQTRYEKQQGKEHPKQIELIYQANVTKYSNFRIYNSPAPEGVTWHNNTIVFSTTNGTTTQNFGGMQFFYQNKTTYQMTEGEYDFSFSDCYVIEMKLQYSEVYAPVSAFFATINQIVILDDDFEPVLIGLESGMPVT